MPTLKNPDGSDMVKYDRDIHFLDCAANYDKLCSALVEIACITQMLGNISDVALGIDIPFDIVKDGVRHPATFFGSDSGLGARPLHSVEPISQSVSKGICRSITEASPVEIIASELHFPRCFPAGRYATNLIW